MLPHSSGNQIIFSTAIIYCVNGIKIAEHEPDNLPPVGEAQ